MTTIPVTGAPPELLDALRDLDARLSLVETPAQPTPLFVALLASLNPTNAAPNVGRQV